MSQTPPVVDELGLSGSAIKEEPLCKSKDRARGGKKRMVDIRSVLDSAIQDATADALSQVIQAVGANLSVKYNQDSYNFFLYFHL